MNKYYIFIALIISAAIFYSCDEDTEDVIANPQDQIPSMSADVNGTEWKADAFAGLDTAGLVTITGTKTGDNTFVSIIFENDIQEQSYDLADTTSGVIALYNGLNRSSSGNVTVSNYNTTLNLVSGTFEFETDSTIVSSTPYSVTNGVFTNVKIVSQ